MKRLASVAVLVLTPFTLMAEPEQALIAFEDAFFDDVPIVLSATRLAQPLNESPVAMTVIDREMIIASGARTIPDLLRLVPGFQVGYFDGNSPVAAYHGHSGENSKRVQVLVDGRSVYVPSLAGIPWQDMVVGVDDIDRIEVIRGPNASSYGNNSFFAVVSIITRTAIEDQGHTIKSTLGTRSTVNSYYRYGGQSGELDYRVTVGTQNDDGTRLLNDYTQADYASYRLDYQANTRNLISYQGGIKDLTKDHEPVPDHDIDVLYAYQWIKWDHQISSRHSMSLQYYYNLHDENEFIQTREIDPADLNPALSFIDPFTPSLQLDIKSQRHDIEFNHYINLDDFRLVWGLSARQDEVNANQVFDLVAAEKNKLYRSFIHGEYRFNESWLLNAGVMIEDNDISGNDTSPRLSLIHHINRNDTFRFVFSQATRTPILWEEYANYRLSHVLTQNGGDPLDQAVQDALFEGTDVLTDSSIISSGNLNSEEITSYEFGYITQLMNRKLIIDINIFRDKTDQLIDLVEDVPAPDDNFDDVADDFQNAYQTTVNGLEVSVDYKPYSDFRIYGFYAYLDIIARAFNPDANDRTDRRLEVSAPTNTYGLMLIKHWDNDFDVGLTYFRVGEMDWMDRTGSSGLFYADRSAQAYNKLDLKFSKTERMAKNTLQYSLTFQNILGDHNDYSKTRYTDATQTVIVQPSSISPYGSLQEPAFYFDLGLTFN